MLSISTADRTAAERKRIRYKRTVYGLYSVGIVAMAVGLLLGRELVGSVVYLLGVWAGMLLGAWLRWAGQVTFVDERDVSLMRRASSYTFSAVAVAGLGVFPVLFVLEAAGRYSIGPTTAGALYLFSAMGLLWGAIYGAIRLRS